MKSTIHDIGERVRDRPGDGSPEGRGQEARGRPHRPDWRGAFLAELDADARRGRWGLALIIVAGLHLAANLGCQLLYRPDVNRDPRHLGLWVAEVMLGLTTFRLIAGRGWFRASPATTLVVRLWGTFLILAFNILSFNEFTGFELHWFRLAWCTLSSFAFAATAWLVDLRFLIFAVQMYVTGLLMFRFPHASHGIYGVSWSLAMVMIGVNLERRRRSATRHRVGSPRT